MMARYNIMTDILSFLKLYFLVFIVIYMVSIYRIYRVVLDHFDSYVILVFMNHIGSCWLFFIILVILVCEGHVVLKRPEGSGRLLNVT